MDRGHLRRAVHRSRHHVGRRYLAMTTIKEALAPLGTGILAELPAALIVGAIWLGFWVGLPS